MTARVALLCAMEKFVAFRMPILQSRLGLASDDWRAILLRMGHAARRQFVAGSETITC